jgi:hypothetical protein
MRFSSENAESAWTAHEVRKRGKGNAMLPESGKLIILEGCRLAGRESLICYITSAIFGLAHGVLKLEGCFLCR